VALPRASQATKPRSACARRIPKGGRGRQRCRGPAQGRRGGGGRPPGAGEGRGRGAWGGGAPQAPSMKQPGTTLSQGLSFDTMATMAR